MVNGLPVPTTVPVAGAVNEMLGGAFGCSMVNVETAEEATLPDVATARARMRCVPTGRSFRTIEYGAVVSDPSGSPLL